MNTLELYNKIKDLQRQPNYIYSYKEYIKDGDNYIYVRDCTREEFEAKRKEVGYIEYSWKYMRDGDGIAFMELPTKNDNYGPQKELYNQFLQKFMEENNITKREAFLKFIEEYVEGVYETNALKGVMDIAEIPDIVLKAFK